MRSFTNRRVGGINLICRQDSEVGVMDKISGKEGGEVIQDAATMERIKAVTQFLRSILGKGNETGEVVISATIVVAKANREVLTLIDSIIMKSGNEHMGWSWNGVQRDALMHAIQDIRQV